MTIKNAAITLMAVLCLGLISCSRTPTYDVVINNGRVIDPETYLDSVRSIGISKGKIVKVSKTPLEGRRTIDATDKVVAPGFIDLVAYGQDGEHEDYYIYDGVTTALDTGIGTFDVDHWYSVRGRHAKLNYGVAVGHVQIRISVFNDPLSGPLLATKQRLEVVNPLLYLPTGLAASITADDEHEELIVTLVEQGLKQGALGVAVNPAYTPGVSAKEIADVFYQAARYKAPCFIGLRPATSFQPNDALFGLEEAIGAAKISGAALHIHHLHATALEKTPDLLAAAQFARNNGVDITVDAYPYQAITPAAGLALHGKQEETSKNASLEAETAEKPKVKQINLKPVILPNTLSKSALATVMTSPLSVVVSEGTLSGDTAHPRTAGAFVRMLRKYVVEGHWMALSSAIKKMTLLPAQQLESVSPQFKFKGRLQEGCDADVVVFDLKKLSDKATFENPRQFSEGMDYVMVNGVFVLDEGQLVKGVEPGKALRGKVVKPD
ncbi:MAG: amidohydrolase family protein [Candidatus Margulisiibacteriota bacterium]